MKSLGAIDLTRSFNDYADETQALLTDGKMRFRLLSLLEALPYTAAEYGPIS
jgi:hypothetical protein